METIYRNYIRAQNRPSCFWYMLMTSSLGSKPLKAHILLALGLRPFHGLLSLLQFLNSLNNIKIPLRLAAKSYKNHFYFD